MIVIIRYESGCPRLNTVQVQTLYIATFILVRVGKFPPPPPPPQMAKTSYTISSLIITKEDLLILKSLFMVMSILALAVVIGSVKDSFTKLRKENPVY